MVDDYIYLGVKFNYNNTFIKEINNRLVLGRKAMFSLLSRCEVLELPLDITISLFDKLVVPIITYGSEIWGFSNLEQIELFHRKFLKQVLRVSKYTAKAMTYGELGRTDMKNLIHRRMLNYWQRINAAEPRKFSVILYKFHKRQFDLNEFKSKWCSKIHRILCEIGLPNLWYHNGYNLYQFKTLTKMRLDDTFKQNWYTEIDNNRLCINYRIFKREFSFEKYLSSLDPNLRIYFTKLRLGSHLLPISNARYTEITDRNVCPLCLLDIGDEYQYIMSCPAFDHIRFKYIKRHFY